MNTDSNLAYFYHPLHCIHTRCWGLQWFNEKGNKYNSCWSRASSFKSKPSLNVSNINFFLLNLKSIQISVNLRCEFFKFNLIKKYISTLITRASGIKLDMFYHSKISQARLKNKDFKTFVILFYENYWIQSQKKIEYNIRHRIAITELDQHHWWEE